jgi:N-acetylglucosamine-6-phosphate deacetylase
VIAAVNPLPQSEDTEYAAEHDAPAALATDGTVAAVRPRRLNASADDTAMALSHLLRGGLIYMHLHGSGGRKALGGRHAKTAGQSGQSGDRARL